MGEYTIYVYAIDHWLWDVFLVYLGAWITFLIAAFTVKVISDVIPLV